MKKYLIGAGVILLIGVAVAHWYFSDRGRFTTAPQYTNLARQVLGNDLVSENDPAAILRFDPAFKHLGGQQFILYGVANTEQHFFVDTTANNTLKSVYWIQYEAYLPSKPYTYDYDDSPLRLTLGEYEFFTDIELVKVDPNRKRRRGTDGAMARQFLTSKGYSFPNVFAYARMVYLTDESRQKELMIIFIDDISGSAINAESIDDLAVDDPIRQRLEQAHLERIQDTLSVLPYQIIN